MRKVYLDHAATTPTDPRVVEEMLPYFNHTFGNPSSVHHFGREAKEGVERARERVAKALGSQPEEIIFTSGGSEADNLAIKGVAWAYQDKGRHIITSTIEHHAVLDVCHYLEKNGFRVTYLPVDKDGLVDPHAVEEAITPETILVTIMHANNEVGTIEPIAEIAAVAHRHGVLVHTDAVQSVGQIPFTVEELGVDLLSLSAHKFYGPKGVGALYCRKGTRLTPLVHGGGQERGRRSGTENVPGIVGLGKALELAVAEMEERYQHLLTLRERLIQGLFKSIDEIRLNGHPTKRLPGNVNISVNYVEGESLLLNLDLEGIAASTGSACASGSLQPSHVLLAMGIPREIAHSSLRLTLGRENTVEDIDYVLEVMPQIVTKLRQMSPLYQGARR